MNQPLHAVQGRVAFFRLTVLWVLTEAVLGGILYNFHVPFTGLIISSGAVVIVTLMAWYASQHGSILIATLIVALMKFMLSPSAPLPAYFSLFFQGLLGELLFHRRHYYRIFCVAFGVLVLLETGIQKVLVLTILYGNDMRTALEAFFSRITGQEGLTDYSFFIIVCYLLAHITAGALLGIWSGAIPMRMKLMWHVRDQYPLRMPRLVEETAAEKKIRIRRQIIFTACWLALGLLFLQSHFHWGASWLPESSVLNLTTRILIIVLSWVVFLNPMLVKLLRGRRLPLGILFSRAWEKTAGLAWYKRIWEWVRIVVAYAFTEMEGV